MRPDTHIRRRGKNVGREKENRGKTHARKRWSRDRRVMLDEDGSPVECTECIHPAHLLAGFSSDWDDSDACEQGFYPRVGDTNTPWDRKVGRNKLGKEDRTIDWKVRADGTEGCGRLRGDELGRQEIQKLQRSSFHVDKVRFAQRVLPMDQSSDHDLRLSFVIRGYESTLIIYQKIWCGKKRIY